MVSKKVKLIQQGYIYYVNVSALDAFSKAITKNEKMQISGIVVKDGVFLKNAYSAEMLADAFLYAQEKLNET